MLLDKNARESYTARRSFHKAGLPRRVCVPLGAVQTRLRMIPGVPRFYGVGSSRDLGIIGPHFELELHVGLVVLLVLVPVIPGGEFIVRVGLTRGKERARVYSFLPSRRKP